MKRFLASLLKWQNWVRATTITLLVWLVWPWLYDAIVWAVAPVGIFASLLILADFMVIWVWHEKMSRYKALVLIAWLAAVLVTLLLTLMGPAVPLVAVAYNVGRVALLLLTLWVRG